MLHVARLAPSSGEQCKQPSERLIASRLACGAAIKSQIVMINMYVAVEHVHHQGGSVVFRQQRRWNCARDTFSIDIL